MFGHGIQRIEQREDLCDDTMSGAFLMVILDKLAPRQCLVVGEILAHRTGLLRQEIAERTGKDEKTIERILKSLPKSILRKKRDVSLNGTPYRYKAMLAEKSR